MKFIPFLMLLVLLNACGKQTSLSSELEDKHIVPIVGYYGNYEAKSKQYGYPAEKFIKNVNDSWDLTITYDNSKQHNIAVLFPNKESSDPYWSAVRGGIEQQAIQSKFSIDILASDSYAHTEQHRQQFKKLAATQPDAIIIGAIHYRAMDDLIAMASNGYFGKQIPVISIINDLYAPQVAGKVMVSFTDMGQKAGEYIIQHALDEDEESIRIAFLPGPINSGWAPESLSGFIKAVRDYPGGLDLIEPVWGTPTPEKQRQLLENLLSEHDQIDYIVGNAVAAAEAVKLLKTMGRENDITIVSTYYSPAIEPLLANGRINAAPSDQPDILGRIAVSMIDSLLNGKTIGKDIPFRVAPDIKMITKGQLEVSN